ncbi:MAG: hypothetical protein ABI647_25260 [Gemmatimonadota bacterium]
MVEWEWDGGAFLKSRSAAGVPFPQSRALAALPDGRFVLYDWFTTRGVEIQPSGNGLALVAPGG